MCCIEMGDVPILENVCISYYLHKQYQPKQINQIFQLRVQDKELGRVSK